MPLCTVDEYPRVTFPLVGHRHFETFAPGGVAAVFRWLTATGVWIELLTGGLCAVVLFEEGLPWLDLALLEFVLAGALLFKYNFCPGNIV